MSTTLQNGGMDVSCSVVEYKGMDFGQPNLSSYTIEHSNPRDE